MIVVVGGVFGLILFVMYSIFHRAVHSGDSDKLRETTARELIVMRKYIDPTEFAYKLDLAIANDPKLAKHYKRLLKIDPDYLKSKSVDSNGREIAKTRSIWPSVGIFFLKCFGWFLIMEFIVNISGIGDDNRKIYGMNYVFPTLIMVIFSFSWWFPKHAKATLSKMNVMMARRAGVADCQVNTISAQTGKQPASQLGVQPANPTAEISSLPAAKRVRYTLAPLMYVALSVLLVGAFYVGRSGQLSSDESGSPQTGVVAAPTAVSRTTNPTPGALLQPAEQFKTSFDCAGVTSKVLSFVCSNRDLAAADVRMAGIYRELIARLDFDQRAAARDAQRHFIAVERGNCADQACIAAAYAQSPFGKSRMSVSA